MDFIRIIKRKFYQCIVFTFCLLFLAVAYAEEPLQKNHDGTAEQPPHKGNFSLPLSQQPGPLLGLGSNILNKNQTQLFYDTIYVNGENTYSLGAIPSALYGIRDDLSIFVDTPVDFDLKYNNNHSAGMADMSIQLEYVYYSDQTKRYTHQSTVAGNITLPTGSSGKNPPTGFGSTSYLLGTTFNRTYVEWFSFGFLGALLTTTHDATKYGDQYFYQYGLGRNIYSVPDKLITAWMIEIDGQYSDINKIHGSTDPNSGGNVITATPSLWFSGQHIIVQMGAGVPVVQHLVGDQNKNDYLLTFSVGWTI